MKKIFLQQQKTSLITGITVLFMYPYIGILDGFGIISWERDKTHCIIWRSCEKVKVQHNSAKLTDIGVLN